MPNGKGEEADEQFACEKAAEEVLHDHEDEWRVHQDSRWVVVDVHRHPNGVQEDHGLGIARIIPYMICMYIYTIC